MTEPKFGYGTFSGWLKAQMALTPLLALAGAAAMVLADSHFDDRYVNQQDGDQVAQTVDEVQRAVTEVQKTQAVNAEKIINIESSVEDLKKQSDTIEAKIDRLIERR